MGVTEAEEARTAALKALVGSPGPVQQAEALAAVSSQLGGVTAAHDTRPTAKAWRAYSAGLAACGRLIEWQNAVRAAKADANRFLDAAHLLAREAREQLGGSDPLLQPIDEALAELEAASNPADVAPCLERLRGVPLPLPLAAPASAPRGPVTQTVKSRPEPEPIAVALFTIGGEPAQTATLVETDRFVSLGLQLRLTEWPDWADRLIARALSVAGDSASFPVFSFDRPAERDADGLWTIEADGVLVIRARKPLGEPPLTFTLLVELTSSAEVRSKAVRTAGQRELQLWATDHAPGSYFTGSDQLDARVAEILGQLQDNPGFGSGSDGEREEFARLLRGLLRATTAIQRRGH